MPLPSPDEHRFSLLVARAGVPLLILVYYATATQQFEYTPDSTFATLGGLHRVPIDSLWTALVALMARLGADAVLTAKVFSLVLCSASILLSFLIANEMVRDPLLALVAALAVAYQAWLIQLGPAGSGEALALALTLGTMFFLLRNEYLLAVICAGLASLVAWQAAGLLPVLLLDVFLNSIDKTRSAKVISGLVLVFAAVVLPWGLYCLYRGEAIIPTLEQIGRDGAVSLHFSFEILLLMGTMFVGVVFLMLRDRLALTVFLPVLLWIAIASFSGRAMLPLAVPLMIAYVFFLLQRIARSYPVRHLGYILALVLGTLGLAYNQLVVFPAVRSSTNIALTEQDELRDIARWLRANIEHDQPIAAPRQFEGLLTFYSERQIRDGRAPVVVTNAAILPGYHLAYSPPSLDSSLSHYRVWRKE